ncbi:sodium/potassium/calcium exchanger 1 isoform X1 [Phycodurus eques]|uniref:sodium/potassium/calcium exchanger 1 isoform X1 n=1 Tax=Phycodurus eques TaxID=693459 RepID=UPI002ACEE3BE|nr:sodium/potassium/calcium exchanger 1 isoform X1 [Phycodurus eques]XP_061531921.1 sodium/potassium/calcium exchanger 1 isoform X1 [Phycodurus eques]
MYCLRRKRLQLRRVLFLLAGVFICIVYQLTLSAGRYETSPSPQIGDAFTEGSAGWVEDVTPESREKPRNQTTPVTPSNSTADDNAASKTPPPATTNRTIVHCIYVPPDPKDEAPTSSSPGDAPHMKGEYPTDVFSVEERRRGWVTLHIFGMMYMFVSLAIVCDEFFVPALGVIIDKLEISDDVAGATFMAAGGSAPELFTSLIGVFVAHSNVGIGTIVGSAVFNILFVIGMCALFSREVLHLTWWPLFRDVSFYIVDLILLIIFFLDNVIMWWESMMLVASYTVYVIFMKFNAQIEHVVKTQLYKHKSIVQIITDEEPEVTKVNGGGQDNAPPDPEDRNRLKLKPSLQRGGSSASLHNSTMRNTIFQLMIHTLDPLGEGGKFKDKAESLNNVVRRKAEGEVAAKSEDGEDGQDQAQEDEAGASEKKKEPPEEEKEDQPAGGDGSDKSGSVEEDSEEDDSDEDDSDDDSSEDEDKENEEEPLSLAWPDTRRKRVTYLILLPIVFPLWLTVPDVRKQNSRKFFVVTFLGSILWIAIFSYLMMWWAHQVGETIGISEEIMGLTILAAGTSIPDLITSVIVARKGLGDMAVSSSVGSNIFDITVGLPLPWLMYSFIHGMVPVAVSSNGLFCAIVLLFLMLLFVIISIASYKWKMNKALGFTMFLLYFIFLVLSVMLEDRIIVCPVSI